ncbi:hypothetical protein NDU88_000223 [Pleurodeles waltl]|uniref:Uncharacterized protein n=1 Tax=Pleurodeles waltl TaxID=8319 RepID=A0AAV7S903_PLEWA|nr:hypothetical protein NDU88_000223 [Pleurodeles waltl]
MRARRIALKIALEEAISDPKNNRTANPSKMAAANGTRQQGKNGGFYVDFDFVAEYFPKEECIVHKCIHVTARTAPFGLFYDVSGSIFCFVRAQGLTLMDVMRMEAEIRDPGQVLECPLRDCRQMESRSTETCGNRMGGRPVRDMGK